MGKKLSNAPVYYTVAQIQFNPVLDLDNYIPSIQSKMREAHFPDYKKEAFQRISLPFGNTEQGLAAPILISNSRYLFGNIDGCSLFILETNALSFQTTNYDTFETFSKTLLNGLKIVHDALRLDFVERIGLRYLNAVQPSKDGETLHNFMVPEVLGLALQKEGELQHSVSETVFTTAAGQLVSRVLIRDGQVGLPMGLDVLAPTIASRFTTMKNLHATIDTDASFAQREAFDIAKVESRLTSLHGEIDKFFNATVTAHARASWA